MLYKFNVNEHKIEPMPYVDFEQINKKEKDLENLLAKNLGELFIENGQLMTIFQERAGQEEPDICALDKDGNLVIFELKRAKVLGDTSIQVMRYAQAWGQKSYYELEEAYKNYCKMNDVDFQELKENHKEAFGLDESLETQQFNRKQRLFIVGSCADNDLISAVEYWKSKGLEIDYMPYRVYEIKSELYFEFFSKPYDVHVNEGDVKGIVFDTNLSYDKESVWDMMNNSKISAYGSVASDVKRFNKGDYVFYYHKGYGIIAAGTVKDSKPKEKKDANGIQEMYREVNLITPRIRCADEMKCISYKELIDILNHGFYLARTTKVPYLNKEECVKVVDKLKEKYQVGGQHNK